MVASVARDGSCLEGTGSAASRPVIGGVRAQLFKKGSQGDLVSTTSAIRLTRKRSLRSFRCLWKVAKLKHRLLDCMHSLVPTCPEIEPLKFVL